MANYNKIQSQIPDNLISDYPILVEFISAYYEFLDIQIANIKNNDAYYDIDNSIESFKQYFYNELLLDIPKNVLVDKTLLAKHIKELYVSKGNENSFRLLFRILFNKEIEIHLPEEEIFKLSSGRWIQNFSFMVEINSSVPFSVIEKSINNKITVELSGKLLPVRVVSIAQLVSRTSGYNLYEFFIIKDFEDDISSATNISFNKISALNIISGGNNYKNPVTISFSSIDGGNATASATVKNGKIYSVELIHSGYGYIFPPSVNIQGTTGSGAYINAEINNIFVGKLISSIGIPTIVQSTDAFVEGAILNVGYSNEIFFEKNILDPNSNINTPNSYNAIANSNTYTVGPVTIKDGTILTVPTGSSFVVYTAQENSTQNNVISKKITTNKYNSGLTIQNKYTLFKSRTIDQNTDSIEKVTIGNGTILTIADGVKWTIYTNKEQQTNSIKQYFDDQNIISQALIKIKRNDTKKNTKNISLVDFGGYYPAELNYVIPEDASVARATAIIYNGSIEYIALDYGGYGYRQVPEVYIQGNAKFSAVISNGSITGFIKINGGSGYTTPPAIYFSKNSLVLNFKSSILRQYEGYYDETYGMLSSNMHIYDGKYYQNFSYEIAINELFDSYKNIVKKLIHPSGYGMFASYDQQSNIYFPITIEKVLSEKRVVISDKPKNTQIYYSTITKVPTAEIANTIEKIAKTINTKKSDNIYISDIFNVNIAENIKEIISTSETISFEVTKYFSDTSITTFVNVDGYYNYNYTALNYTETADCSFT